MEDDGLNEEFVCDNCGSFKHCVNPHPDDKVWFDARDVVDVLEWRDIVFWYTCDELILLKVMHS